MRLLYLRFDCVCVCVCMYSLCICMFGCLLANVLTALHYAPAVRVLMFALAAPSLG